MIELISKLEKEGTLKILMRSGFVSTKMLLYYNVYLEYDKHLRIHNEGTVEAIGYVCAVFNISESTAYRIIKILK